MDMEQIRCAFAVARHRSFTEAAFRLDLSQSSVSKKVALLEKELGAALFDRTTRTVVLTPAGEEFVRHGGEILRQQKLLLRKLRPFGKPDGKHLVVGSIYFAPSQGIADCVARFASENPAVEIETIYETTSPLIEALLQGDIDVAIVSSMYTADASPPPNFASDGRFVSASLDISPYFLVVSEQHPLARRKTVDYPDIRGEKLVTLDKNMDVYHRAVNRIFEEEGIKPNIVVQSGSIQEALFLVSRNVGVSIFSGKVASDFAGVRLIEFRRPLLRDTQAVIRNEKHVPAHIRNFYDYIGTHYAPRN